MEIKSIATNFDTLSATKVKKIIEECLSQPRIVFGEILAKCYLDWKEFNWWNKNFPDDMRVRMLNRTKHYLEVQMEKLLVYQDSEKQFYNYKQLAWVLAKMNPEVYGEKVKVENSSLGLKDKLPQYATMENTSQISFLKEKN